MSGPARGLSVEIDVDDPVPVFEQIRRQLEVMIRAGVLPPGQRLPALRQLAGDLNLAVGTVARTYAALEASGLVISRRGAGTRVTTTLPTLAGPALDSEVASAAGSYVRHARQHGASDRQIAQAVAAVLRS